MITGGKFAGRGSCAVQPGASVVPQASSSTALASAVSTTGGESPPATSGLMRTLKLATYFALWYALNVGYNIYNKVRKFYSSGLGGYSD